MSLIRNKISLLVSVANTILLSLTLIFEMDWIMDYIPRSSSGGGIQKTKLEYILTETQNLTKER